MSACPRRDDWDDASALLQRVALRRFGRSALSVTLNFHGGDRITLPLPLPAGLVELPMPAPAGAGTVGRAAGGEWASGPEPKHLSDFQQVYWPGLGTFRFAGMRARAVEALWEARFELGNPDVSQAELLRAAGSDDTRLNNLFKRDPAWGVLIVQGEQPGTYRLPDPPEPGEEDRPAG